VAGEVTDLRHDIDSCLFSYEQSGQLALYHIDTVDPVVSNDNTEGYSLFSRWINTTVPQKEFVLLDSTTGAAIWKETTDTTSGTGVDSVFTRTGNVVAVAGDYQASKITNDSSVAGAFVKQALEQLDSDKVGTAGVINDTEHGNLSGGLLHAVATPSIAGFMSPADKTKLDGITTGATNTPLAATAPVDVTKAAAVIGVSAEAAHADHKHNILTAMAVTITSLTNAEGILTSLARSDHKHAHGDLIGGTLHAEATPVSSGFMSYGDKDKLDSIEAGADVNDVNSVFTRTGAVVAVAGDYDASQVDNDSTVPGTFVDDALDYLNLNKVPTTRLLTAGDGLTGGGNLSANRTFNVVANADGSITVNPDDIQVGILATDAQHGVRGGGTQHALVTVASAGFMSPTDKIKLDGIGSGATSVWQEVVLDKDLTAPPIGPSPNDRYIVAAVATGAWIGREDNIAQWTGTGWSFLPPTEGFTAYVADDNRWCTWNGSWSQEITHTSRILTAGAGLTGGGDLTADRTFNVVANADGSITVNANDVQVGVLATNAQHGVRGGGTQHALATTLVAGFMSDADKTKLDGIASGAAALTATPPVNVTKSAAVVGVGTTAARHDHKHDIDTAIAGTISPDDTADEGTATTLSRSDHRHAIAADAPTATGVATASAEGVVSSFARSDHAHQANTAPVDVTKAAAAIGVSGEPARADHKHDVSTAAVLTVAQANTEGTATSLARSDHVHSHGDQPLGDGLDHALATANPGGIAGFMSPEDKTTLTNGGITIAAGGSLPMPELAALTGQTTFASALTFAGATYIVGRAQEFNRLHLRVDAKGAGTAVGRFLIYQTADGGGEGSMNLMATFPSVNITVVGTLTLTPSEGTVTLKGGYIAVLFARETAVAFSPATYQAHSAYDLLSQTVPSTVHPIAFTTAVTGTTSPATFDPLTQATPNTGDPIMVIRLSKV
jgi:hypothetical protein